MDGERVIKGLECCAQGRNDADAECGSCPYNDNSIDCGENLMADALELLKAQEPVVPQERNGNYFCWCGNRLHKTIETDRFCSKCGRRVKWDG